MWNVQRVVMQLNSSPVGLKENLNATERRVLLCTRAVISLKTVPQVILSVYSRYFCLVLKPRDQLSFIAT